MEVGEQMENLYASSVKCFARQAENFVERKGLFSGSVMETSVVREAMQHLGGTDKVDPKSFGLAKRPARSDAELQGRSGQTVWESGKATKAFIVNQAIPVWNSLLVNGAPRSGETFDDVLQSTERELNRGASSESGGGVQDADEPASDSHAPRGSKRTPSSCWPSRMRSTPSH